MKTLYLDCNMGAAGDMLMSALLELHSDPEGFIERLNSIGIPDIKIEKHTVSKCGIQGTGINVYINGCEEDDDIHGHSHEHNHEHSHEHHHTGMNDINEIIKGLKVSDKVRSDIADVYRLIAEAESHAHGRPIEQIHFHEVGTMDAVADIAGVCMLIEELAPDRIVTSPVGVGSGQVRCAHGILPVPAPATAHILMGVPVSVGGAEGELCTPTGAALLKHFTDEFSSKCTISADAVGYGMGKRHFYGEDGTEILSAVRAIYGESENMKDSIIILSCNIDDMTGEQTGFASERLMDGGALDVFTIPVYMKKNRPGILLTVICSERNKDEIVRLMFKYTTTIGIRETASERYILARTEEKKHTKYGDVRIKKSAGYGVSREKAEYEDIKEIAVRNNVTLTDILK